MNTLGMHLMQSLDMKHKPTINYSVPFLLFISFVQYIRIALQYFALSVILLAEVGKWGPEIKTEWIIYHDKKDFVRTDSRQLLWRSKKPVVKCTVDNSVPDPWHFGTDPDADLELRIRTFTNGSGSFRQLCTFRTQQKMFISL